MKARYAKNINFPTTGEKLNPNQTSTFAKFPNWLMKRKELSPGAKIVYCRMGQYAGNKNYARVKQETLCMETGFSLRQTRDYIKELEHFALIKIQQIGLTKCNIYYLLDHPWMHEENKPTQSKRPYPIATTENNHFSDRQDPAGQDRRDPAGQDRRDPAGQDRRDPAGQDRRDPAGPLKRYSEKIQLKEHTQKRDSVCVSSSKISLSPSDYSKEQWDKYTKAQKGVHNPEGLADSLSRSKENDYLMKRFLESQDKDKTAQSLKLEQDKQRQLKVAQDMEGILASTLASLNANEPLLPWQIQLLEFKGYSFPHQQVS